jgi:hypothetical protein
VATALALLLLASAAGATSICRWVDENGRSQISDNVPQQYRPVASCIDSQLYELSPAQRLEAAQRASAALAAQRSRAASKAAGEATVRVPPPSVAASQPIAKRPVETVTDATDCQSWWRIFDESGSCFGPYRTIRGGLKPDAFAYCNEVPSPELKCGPRRN